MVLNAMRVITTTSPWTGRIRRRNDRCLPAKAFGELYSDIAADHRFVIRDTTMMIAAATRAGCLMLLSEDMQEGVIGAA